MWRSTIAVSRREPPAARAERTPSSAVLCRCRARLSPCENDQDRLHALDPQAFPRDGRTAYQLRFAAVQALVDSLTTASPVKVIYHSHVDAGADFSTEDRAAALHLGQPLFAVDYLVIDVGAGRVRGAKLFRFDGHDFALAIEYDGCGRLKR